ncbi:flagellar biosynthetic protein FliO [Mesorhizobium sp. YIM 152430]|uniref:flagellar biosynthetic protein FliO n=1 Tax=Mesorhizobium sp. YIM 152430 TaxID=3031761 RepID=UPI0023DC8E60|nr:flagellar biosynthetic protein FliO [Mesorhizobium sp. YIM 152430]MDF1599991.1 flagellar biosynthetic protein FliO [Mesorhizobium sp. YIM 152430]
MPTWFEDIAGPGYAGAVMWTLVALVALGVIMLIIKIVRRVSGGSFASAGSYRSRLAVMDAAEVDTQRRLVLVRRDEVEHLIMIGGPTDIVIEQNITGPGRSAALPVAEAPVARVPRTERQTEPTRTEPPVADSPPIHREPSPAPARHVAEEPRIERRQPLAPVASATGAPRAEPRSEPAIAERVAASEPTVDEAMVSEFERDFQSTQASQRREPTIEDEMDRLLNEAPRERR